MISAHRPRMPPSAPTTAHAMPGSGDSLMLSVRMAGVYSAWNHTTTSATAYSGSKTSSHRRTTDCITDPIADSAFIPSPFRARCRRASRPLQPGHHTGAAQVKTGAREGDESRSGRRRPWSRSASLTTATARSARNGLTSMRSTPCSRSRSGSRRCPQPVMRTTRRPRARALDRARDARPERSGRARSASTTSNAPPLDLRQRREPVGSRRSTSWPAPVRAWTSIARTGSSSSSTRMDARVSSRGTAPRGRNGSSGPDGRVPAAPRPARPGRLPSRRGSRHRAATAGSHTHRGHAAARARADVHAAAIAGDRAPRHRQPEPHRDGGPRREERVEHPARRPPRAMPSPVSSTTSSTPPSRGRTCHQSSAARHGVEALRTRCPTASRSAASSPRTAGDASSSRRDLDAALSPSSPSPRVRASATASCATAPHVDHPAGLGRRGQRARRDGRRRRPARPPPRSHRALRGRPRRWRGRAGAGSCPGRPRRPD